MKYKQNILINIIATSCIEYLWENEQSKCKWNKAHQLNLRKRKEKKIVHKRNERVKKFNYTIIDFTTFSTTHWKN